MHRDIRLHGLANDQVEYFVTLIGPDAYQGYFFNVVQDEGQLRIFAPGNELIISGKGISYRGNGGHFCEYMFGVDHPTSDFAKPDIINRLVMYGAHSDEAAGTVNFSDQTSGSDSFKSIFFEGNAVCNYYFFIHSAGLPQSLKAQQEELVRRIGKLIKRSAFVGDERDDALSSEIYPLLGDTEAQLFMFKLIHRHHRKYRDLFRQLYFRSKKIADEDFSRLVAIATQHEIDRYQQERMRIDVMYRHPANKRIVDEYREILLICNQKGEISKLDNARLTRLKTLSVRNKIPGALFYTLDEMLKKGRRLRVGDEEDYLGPTRGILEGIFLQQKDIESRVDRDDMLELIRAKKHAVENRDHAFDQLMLAAGKECDERIRDGADPSLLDGFSYIITYLDRFDSVTNLISQLAFMENVRISEEILRELMEHKAAFDNLKTGCFQDLFVRELFENAYLGRFGRLKVKVLIDGIQSIETGAASIDDLLGQLQQIDLDERISIVLLEHVRDRIRNFYSRFNTRADQEALRREVTEELKTKKSIKAEIPDHLFNETIITIKKEAMYLHTLLPAIITEHNICLREDFLANSGIDRFYVEELEREYYEKNGLDMEELYKIRKGLS